MKSINEIFNGKGAKQKTIACHKFKTAYSLHSVITTNGSFDPGLPTSLL